MIPFVDQIVTLAAGAARGVAESLGFLEIGSLLVQLGGLAPKGNPIEGEIHESHNMPRRFTPYSPNMTTNSPLVRKSGGSPTFNYPLENEYGYI